MTFILIPTDGPAQIVRQHVTPASLSDALGGAFPVGLAVSRGEVTCWLRETCATDGSIRNPLASVLAFILSGAQLAPMAGPVALTGLGPPRGGGRPRAAACLSGEDAERLTATLYDVWSAIDVRDQDIIGECVGGVPAWANAVRHAAGLAYRTPFPPGFPYPTRTDDRLADLFSRLGITVAPQHTGRI